MGEPAGVGGEIVLKAWRRRHEGLASFFVIDDGDRLGALGRRLGLAVPVRVIDDARMAPEVFPDALPVVHRQLPKPVVAGHPDPATAGAVIAAIDEAVALVRCGAAAAVVTNPIHKKVLYDAGFAFPGHTEFLAALAGPEVVPVMMLASGDLRVVPVTVHVSLRRALDSLTRDGIVGAGTIVAAALRADFGVARPALAVAGVNPHAGEGGAMGDEERQIVAPAVEALRAVGIDATGPWPPDTLFTAEARSRYDVALCMYHDQALIPIKALCFDRAVNVTLGLPFVRTSPDHGTALDIAGSGRADESSLMAALRMAAACAERRAAADGPG
jgi:4-hydroxythreonine-4-phosphate dehydrogenase